MDQVAYYAHFSENIHLSYDGIQGKSLSTYISLYALNSWIDFQSGTPLKSELVQDKTLKTQFGSITISVESLGWKTLELWPDLITSICVFMHLSL